MQGNQSRFVQWPAEPCRREAEGRRRGHHQHFCRVDVAREHRSDAVEKRIAGGEHADVAAAMGENVFDRTLERARPGVRVSANERGRERKMAFAAEYDFGGGNQPACRRAQPLDSVLADADDGQPAVWCGSVLPDRISAATCAFSFLAARRRRGSWPSGLPRAPISTFTLSLAGRTASARCPTGACTDRRLRRRPGACRSSGARA